MSWTCFNFLTSFVQTHLLEELKFQFDIIGSSETKITNSNLSAYQPYIPEYNFEFVPTRLSVGGVGLFIDEAHNYYRVVEKTSNESFQAWWIEISFVRKKNIICGLIYRQLNKPEQFLRYFEETIEKFSA